MASPQVLPRLLGRDRAPGGSGAPEPTVVHPGRLLRWLAERPAGRLAEYRAAGGYGLAERLARPAEAAEVPALLDRAGLRGRAGGGFPTGLKWQLVAESEAAERYFVCNAHASPWDSPWNGKLPHLLAAAPHRLLEAILAGALAVGARVAYLALPAEPSATVRRYQEALAELGQSGLLALSARGPLEIRIFPLSEAHVAGEETALCEAIEGRPAQPRTKPPLPVERGLFGAPTAINNLETVLQALLAIELGPEEYRRLGSRHAAGTMVFSLGGEVERPGLYELPLGTPLSVLVEELGGGVCGGRRVKAVLPGGLTSPALDGGALGVPLDFDSLRDAGSDLGAGGVLVVPDDVSAVDLAAELAAAFHQASCGKCQPCHDGTERTWVMLGRLEELDEKSIDLAGRALPASKRRGLLRVLDNEPQAPSGVSYTDTAEGLEKIDLLCEFYKYRGDCHHTTEAATSIQRLLTLFRDEFEARRRGGEAPGGGARPASPARSAAGGA